MSTDPIAPAPARPPELRPEALAELAHRLRDPLTPLRNAAYALSLAPAADALGAIRGVIDRQTELLSGLIDDLLRSLGKAVDAATPEPAPVARPPAEGSPRSHRRPAGPARRAVVVGGTRGAEELARLVGGCGYAVRVADDADEGVRLAAAHRPEVVVVDADGSPGGWAAGVPALRRAAGGEPVVVVVTSRPDRDRRGVGPDAGVVFLTRPWSPAALGSVLAAGE